MAAAVDARRVTDRFRIDAQHPVIRLSMERDILVWSYKIRITSAQRQKTVGKS